ncbi:MAG: hypothetical protein ACXAEB_02160 [Candidatus Thorarchaeota archaeon]|jgi:hypothetical protein
MIEKFATALQAMYASNEIPGFLCVQVPEEITNASWIEKGVLFKGVRGSLSSKANQSQYVRPLHESTRVFADRRILDESGTGILIVGEQGLVSRKFIVLLLDAKESGIKQPSVVSFWSKDYSPHDLIRLILKHGLGRALSTDFKEPDLDYIEHLKVDSSEGKVREAFSVKIPKGRFNPSSWIQKCLEDETDDSDEVLFRYGKLQKIPVFSLLYSSWFNSFDLLEQQKRGVASILIVRKNQIEVVLWDRPRNIATFIVFSGTDLEKITSNYLLPMWALPTDRMDPPVRTRDVVVSLASDSPKDTKKAKKVKDQPPSTVSSSILDIDRLEEPIRAIRKILDNVSVDELLSRIESVERGIGDLQRLIDKNETQRLESKSPGLSERPETDAILSRLRDVVDSMENLSVRLSDLEKRVQKVQKVKKG